MSLFYYFYIMPYKNKEDQAKCARKHYDKNKHIYKERATAHTKISRIRNKKYILEYLKTHPCVDCGEDDVIVLEFDHVRGVKSENISDIHSRGWSIKRIQEEIDKCEVRCANCHRRVTYKRRNGLIRI